MSFVEELVTQYISLDCPAAAAFVNAKMEHAYGTMHNQFKEVEAYWEKATEGQQSYILHCLGLDGGFFDDNRSKFEGDVPNFIIEQFKTVEQQIGIFLK